MTKLVLATVASFALVSSVFAADMPRREPAPAAGPVGKHPVGKGPVGKGPVGKGPVGKAPVAVRG
jgi:hypothetical protein